MPTVEILLCSLADPLPALRIGSESRVTSVCDKTDPQGVQVVGTSLLAERDALGADASGTSPNGSDAARLLASCL